LSDVNQASKVLQKPESAPKEVEVAAAPEDSSAAAEPTSSTAGDKPEAPMSLTLGTVDYNDRGDIIFSGTAEPGSGIRLYVDNKLAGDAASATDGSWIFADREDIAPGTHSLRVDQLRPDGSVAKRIELPFMRAAPQEVASLNEPAVSAESSKSEPEEAPAAAAAEEPPAAASAEPPAAAPAAMEESAGNETTVVKTEPPPVEPAPVQPEPQSVAAAGETPAAAAPTSAAPTTADLTQARNGKIVIQPGNSLWRISRVIYGRGVEFTTIYQANKEQIRNPNLIYPGQIFATPGVVPPETIDPQSTTPLASTSDSPTSQQ
jgi:nucleoid-associated protein YgaU